MLSSHFDVNNVDMYYLSASVILICYWEFFNVYSCRNIKMSAAKRFRPAPTVEQIQTDVLTKVSTLLFVSGIVDRILAFTLMRVFHSRSLI